MDVRSQDGGPTDMGLLLVVTAQAAITPLTAKDLFDEPPLGEQHKSLLLGIPADNLQLIAHLLLDLLLELLSATACIGKNGSQIPAPRGFFDINQQAQSTGALIGVGRNHNSVEQIAAHVTEFDTLAPFHFFSAIIAFAPATPLGYPVPSS
ncbi:hypothetical protein IAD21_00171 [Abditibacteriota bacterium]|nr:hypothetical protein IAD21_00171 [Abditibacteriota bacterium]